MGAAIAGLGTAVPDAVLSNKELAERVDVSEQWIFERTGISARRIANEGESTSTLATLAGARALERAGVEPKDVDAVIVATVTPDYQFPAVGPMVVAALGVPGVCAFDLNAGCSGFLYGLSQAASMVDSGSADRVLLIGADVLSRITDYSDARSCVLFGDGAGAALVEAEEGSSKIGPFRLGADGSRPELLYVPNDTRLIHMEGREVYRHAVAEMARSVRTLLAGAEIRVDDVDLLVAHQANARILAAVAERLALPEEKVITNIARFGNTSAASIPLALAEAEEEGMLHEGALVVLTAFGAGFTWGAGIVHWVHQRSGEPLVAVGETHV
jgi:3-oxoacyl-[acyl-carrier-protein] synthase III